MFKALTIHYSPLTKKMQRSKKIEMLHFSLLNMTIAWSKICNH
jgi:hypothetical protein